jgi:serine/threonine-protein kinase RsbT
MQKPVRSPSSDLAVPVLLALSHYVTPPTALSIVTLARQRANVTSIRLDLAAFREVLAPIERSLALFITDPAKAAACSAELHALLGGVALEKLTPIVVQVRIEDDITRARNEARDLATKVGFTLVGRTRLVTAVSELTRNIVLYAGEGEVELKPRATPPGLEVVARDHGPGIPNLADILAGDYKSRLGMGLGLRGVQRIADHFDVQTAAGKGTTVSFSLKMM